MDSAMTVTPFLTPMKPIPTAMHPKGNLHLPVACLLCDIYGTLFISSSGEWTAHEKTPHIKNRLRKLLSEHGFKMAPDHLLEQFHKAIEHYHTRLIEAGNPHPEVLIEKVWQACLPFEDMDQVKRFAIAFETLTNPVWPMPHLKELLAYCRLSGIVLGIISNAQFYTPHLFQWAFNRDMYQLGFDPDLVIFSYQHSIAKPDPLLFSMACEKLQAHHIAPRQTVYIGNDMRNDILPAHGAGFQTVLFAGDKRSLRLRKKDPRCAAYQPDVIITGLHQLISQLNGSSAAIK